MKLAISTNLFKNFPLKQALKIVKSIGYDGVELLTDVPHFYPPQTTITKVFETLELLNNLNLSVSNINAFMFFAVGNSHYPSYLDNHLRIDFTKWSIFTASILGSKTVSIEPCGKQKDDFQTDLNRFINILNTFIPYSKLYKIRVLIEPEPQLLIENVSQALQLVSVIDKYVFGINADIGHFYCVNEKFENLFKILGQYIYHIHIEDIKPNREHFHLIPGDGAIDFAEILYWIKKISYEGWVTVELYPFQNEPVVAAQRAFSYLKKVGF